MTANGGPPLPLYATSGNNDGEGSTSPKRSTSSVTLQRKRPNHRLRSGGGGSKKSGSYSSLLHGDGHPGNEGGGFLASNLHALLHSRNSPLQIFRPSNLTARARTTNLAVLLLLLTLALSLIYNIRFYLHEHPLKGERDRLPLSIKATLPQSHLITVQQQPIQAARKKIGGVKQEQAQARLVVDPKDNSGTDVFKASTNTASTIDLAGLDHLIMVPGHAVWKGRNANEANEDENWVLEEVQKGGSVQTFLKHIMKGAELAVSDPKSLLVFSGGQTRTSAQETEGDSYFRLAEALDLYRQYDVPKRPPPADFGTGAEEKVAADGGAEGGREESEEDGDALAGAPSSTVARVDRQLFPRATTEQFALDSYQNLLFSLCRFKEMTGHYPTKITIVGFGMKRSRFSDIHRHAVKFPSSSFVYIGIDDIGETGQSYLGEKEYGLKPYSEDIYGCKGFLLGKRRARNPHRRVHPYFTSNPLLKDLLEYCPMQGKIVYPGKLPWEDGSS